MRALKFWLFGLLFASSAAFALSGNTVTTENVKAPLVSGVTGIGPGQAFTVAPELDIRDGWHTDWRNPGDSGEPTKLAWQLPPGFTAGDIVWTTPHRFEIAPLVNYGYAKHAVHLVQITAPKDLKTGTPLSLAAKASWLVCSDVCIPEDANLQMTIPTSPAAGGVDPAAATLFSTARGELPSAQPAPTSARISGDKLILTLGGEWGATLSQISSLSFFPYDEGGIEYATPQTLTRTKEALELSMKIGYQPPKAGAIRGALFVTLLVYLLLAVGLNLSGVFEVGGGLAGVGDNLTQGDSYSASFFTGVLATLVATPCSAPFMAPAVGAALTQAPINALCIFAALGIGISLPFVLLSFAPWTRRVLPKPGAWMDTLKQVFAFPVYATAAWLLWVLSHETSSFGLGAALAGTVLIGLAAWAYQKSSSSSGGGKVTVLV